MFLVFFLITSVISAQDQVIINEFMALNQTGITDEDAEFADWIEIYNPTASAVNLLGWSLTDQAEVQRKWVFPSVNLPSKGFLIVYATGKNRINVNGNLHTNFRLSGSGEYLALINASGTKMSAFNPAFPGQYADQSYGYYDGSYILFADATPGKSNALSTAKVIPEPVFSKKHGFYETAFSLAISSGLAGTQIYYTTDGSAPDKGNGNLYSTALSISKTTVLRAVAVTADNSYSSVATRTYLFTSDIIHQPNNPAGYPAKWGPYTQISGDTAIADYEMDPELVADATFAASLKEALKDLPVVSLVTDIDHLFSKERNEQTGGIYIYTGTPVGDGIGKGWERPVSFEMFDDSNISLQVNCGLKLNGGHSRLPEKSPKHSFRLVFKSQYGVSKFNYPLFGNEGVQSFDNIVLRSGFGNSWIHHSHDERQRSQYLRDIWTKDTQREMGHPASNSIYVHLFINGIYWGIYAPSERMDANFAAGYLEGQPEDFDVIKDYAEAVDGEINAWNDLLDAVNTGIDDHNKYMGIQGKNPDGTKNPDLKALVDVENLIDYMLINFYGGNTDWDHHNWAAMRNRVDPGDGFIFLNWDAEHMLKTVGQDVTNEFNTGCPSNIFQQLTLNPEFKRLVADRAQKYLNNGGLLTPEKNIERWNNRSSQIENAVIAESARWGDYRRDVHQHQSQGPFELYTKEDHWLPQREYMLNTYFPQRTSVFIDQLKNSGLYPGVDAPSFKINNTNVTNNNFVKTGDVLSMTVPRGTIYYTLDGTDPVVWAGGTEKTETILVKESDSKKVLVPGSDIGTTWRTGAGFDDNSWATTIGTPGGIGYENGSGYQSFITYDVGDAMTGGGANPSCYVRVKFNVDATKLASLTTLKLLMNYDDGFVAYLNGTMVAASNAPGSPSWNSTSSGGHEGGAPETFIISEHIDLLKAGENLLAIHGLNQSTTSSDFLILPSLIASDLPSGGDVAEGAVQYSAQVNINKSIAVKARAFYNNEWSAMSTMSFMIPDEYKYLKVTEVHYHPADQDTIDDSKFEFIEIKNTGNSTLDLSGVKIVDGVEYNFPDDTPLGPGEFIVLASEDLYFYERYGFMPFDEYKGQLNNDGEWIKVNNPAGDTIIAFRYNDGGNWPALADGSGNSMVPIEFDPVNDQTLPEFWRASLHINGSPGANDSGDVQLPVIEIPLISKASLGQNYPNPFSEITLIDYKIDQPAIVDLSIYNLMGQKISTLVNNRQNQGLYQVEWDGSNAGGGKVNHGIYYYRLEIKNGANPQVFTKKMIYNP